MQTFLPYPDFKLSAKTLDNKRLGKQRVETYQLLTSVTGEKLMTKDPDDPRGKRDMPASEWHFEEFQGRWNQHLAAKMWVRSPEVLILYGIAICDEWIGRGFNDTCLEKIKRYWEIARSIPLVPDWLGDERIHRSHQSNLVRKLPSHYAEQFPGVPDDLEYIWPVPADNGEWRYQEGPTRK